MLKLPTKTKIIIKWLKEGNNNTRYFHHAANRRNSKNHISLLEVDGIEFSNQEVIFNSLSHFFRNLIGTPARTFDIGINWEHLYPADNRASLVVLEEPIY